MHLPPHEIVPVLQILTLAWPGSLLFSRFGYWCLFSLRRIYNNYCATGSFDLFPGRFAERMSRYIQFFRQLAIAENLDSDLLLANYPCFKKALRGHFRAGTEFSKRRQVHGSRFDTEDVGEAAHVGQPLDQRELSTFEQERYVTGLFLALGAAPGIRAGAGAVSTAHALAVLAGVFSWF